MDAPAEEDDQARINENKELLKKIDIDGMF